MANLITPQTVPVPASDPDLIRLAKRGGGEAAPHGFGLKATLLVAASLTVMAGATISPGLPGMREHFADTPNVNLLVRLVLTIPAIFIAIAAPFTGLVIERIGRLRMLTVGALLYAAAGTTGLWMQTLPALLVGRAVLGLAVACVMTTVTTLAGDYFRGQERARFLGQQAAFMGLGGLIFVTGGGFAADLHWRAPFAIYFVALVVLPLAARFLHEPDTMRPIAGAPQEAVPRGVLVVLVAAFVAMTCFYLVPVQLPFLLAQDLGLDSPSLTGIAVGVATTISSLASLGYARFGSHRALGTVLGVGWVLMAIGFALISFADGFVTVLAGMFLVGGGMGATMPSFSTTMLSLVPESRRGRMAGLLTCAIFTGQFVSPLVSQPLAHGFGDLLQPVFGVFAALLAGLALVAFGLAGRIIRRPAAA